jgi:hypothetical protein
VGLINAALSVANRLEGAAPMPRHVPAREPDSESKEVRV